MPDGFGFGLAWKVAEEVAPNDKPNPWAAPGAKNRPGGDPSDPTMHPFQGSWWGGDRCSFQGCGQPRADHDEGAE